jgi:hypothetical protein
MNGISGICATDYGAVFGLTSEHVRIRHDFSNTANLLFLERR